MPFVLSAAAVAVALRQTPDHPTSGVIAVVLVALSFLPSLFARHRVRQLLRSGDVQAVLGAWSRALGQLPHPETMGPLVAAAAFAACGWIDQGRRALERAVRGPAWEIALEHRLFVETMLDAFEGDREAALAKAERLARMPLPPAGPLVRARVRVLRDALGAFARAFAHTSAARDVALLEKAARRSPLVHWAMRYAAAVVAIDHGDEATARRLIGEAPAWPRESAFHAFHAELGARIGLPARA